jgi:hypothetical protein
MGHRCLAFIFILFMHIHLHMRFPAENGIKLRGRRQEEKISRFMTSLSVQCSSVKYIHLVQIPELFHLAKLQLFLYLLNNSPLLLPTAPNNHLSTFCFYEFDGCRSLSGILWYLSFCDWQMYVA